MSLKNSTVLALVSVVYFFVSRAIGTYWPEVFFNIQIYRATAIISLIAVFTFILFYYMVYAKYSVPGKPENKDGKDMLKKAALFAVAGSVIVVPVFVKGISGLFGVYNFIYPDTQVIITLFLILGSAICSLYFAVIFYNETFKYVSKRLVTAAKLAVFGTSLGLVLRIYLVLNYYYSSQFKWSGELTKEIPLIVVPVILLIFYANVNFLWAFFKEQNAVEN